MPGMKGLNCSAAGVPASSQPGSSRATREKNRWKFYDNPFFVAAVASAVVEAGLHRHQENRERKDAEKLKGGKVVEKDENSGVKKQEQQQRQEVVTAKTPHRVQSARPVSVVQKSPAEVKRKTSTEEANQKLRVELLKAWTTIERLEKAHASSRLKAEHLSSRLEDGKSMWESQVQDKITSSLQTMKHKLREEKSVNKSLELANQKLETELAEIRKAISDAKRDVLAERHAKRMIEDVCDELAKEVGEDKAAVDELRKQSTTARREADDTRRALQMGEVWKEEKVQGRLTEARFETEEKSMELEKVIHKVQSFLEEKKTKFDKRMESEEAGCSSAGSSSSSVRTTSTAYREHARLLLNGSGFHMRGNKSYNVRPSFSNGEMPKIWPRMNSDKP